MAMKTRIKTDTHALRVQSKHEAELMIKQIGDTQRELQRVTTKQNDDIAAITAGYAPELERLQNELKPMLQAVQAWCESNRSDLTENGKTKTGYFNTGEVQWRQKPPAVGVRGVDSVIDNLKTLGLTRFIRTKEEINKEAMLNEPDIASTVAGITIRTGVEEFVIKPFEQEVRC